MSVEFSLVIPVYNEAESLPFLSQQIDVALQSLDWECIWVNDGSTDKTMEVLNGISLKNSRFRNISLDGNYGQSAALMIGFENARSLVIGTLDGDGQNDPLDLVEMFDLLKENDFDIVNGYREKRMDSFARKACSKIANTARNFITRETEVKDVGCSTRVFKKICIEHVPLFKGMHRFLPTLIKLKPYKMAQIAVRHHCREQGVTKYTLNNRLWVGIIDLFAVRWMQARLVFPTQIEKEGDKEGDKEGSMIDGNK